MKKYMKKSLIPLLVVMLLLLVTISAIAVFEYKTRSLTEKLQKDILNDNPITKPKLLGIAENKLYIKNKGTKNISIESIEISGVDCYVNENIGVGVGEVDVSSCTTVYGEPNEVVAIIEGRLVTTSFVGEKICFNSPESDFCNGEGTEIIPYEMATCKQLENMNNSLTSYFILIRNINCLDTKNWDDGKGFSPVGNSTHNFYGDFDGQNYTIYNLFINRSNQNNIGLFGRIYDYLNMRNVKLVDFEIYGNNNVGGLVGYGKNINLQNVYGGVDIGGKENVGGLVGYGEDGDFTNNSVTGSVNGDQFVGGLVGFGQGFLTTFTNNYATGSIVGKGNYVGGLVGRGPFTTYKNNYATGNVSGSLYVGGLVGSGNSATFTNNYATGNVSGSGYIGGLVGTGHSATFTNNYATGSLSRYISFTGGLVGDGTCSATQSYYDTQTTGQTTSKCGTGYNTSELQTPTTNTSIYVNWSADIWDFGTASEYPTLIFD